VVDFLGPPRDGIHLTLAQLLLAFVDEDGSVADEELSQDF
jgi:hypothetical protein